MEKQMRKRHANWEDAERILLKKCIENFQDIVENKCTDSASNNEKNLAWQKISQRFNKCNNRERSTHEIKLQWRKMKMEAKNKRNLDNIRVLKITGDPPEPPNLNSTETKIMELLPLEIVENSYTSDSDANNQESETPVSSNKRASFETSSNATKRCKTEENSSVLELLQEQDVEKSECLQRETDLKLQQMVEAHKWARKKHNLEMEHLKIKNQLEIENLKLKKQLLQKQIDNNT